MMTYTAGNGTKMVWRRRWMNVQVDQRPTRGGIGLRTAPGHYRTRSESKAAAAAHGLQNANQVPVKLRIAIEEDV